MASAEPDRALTTLARRLAWSRVLPGTVLFVVGASQPILTVPLADQPPRTLTLRAVVADGQDVIADSGPVQTVAALLLIAVIGAFVLTFVAVENRSVAVGRVLLGSAAAVCLLAILFAAVASKLTVRGADSFAPMPSLLAAGLAPLIVGGLMTGLAVMSAGDSRHLLEPGPREP